MVKARMVALGITASVLGIFVAGVAALGGPQAGSPAAVGTESGERTIEDGGTDYSMSTGLAEFAVPSADFVLTTRGNLSKGVSKVLRFA